MLPQHLTLTEAQKQLDRLVNQSRQTRRSVLITADDGQALAWLAPVSSAVEGQQDQQSALLNAHLSLLDELLQALADPGAAPDVVTLLRDQLYSLYQVAVEFHPLFRQTVLLSRLAVENLGDAQLQPDQLLALRFGLALLNRPVITEDDLRQYNRRLMDNHLHPDIPFDEALLDQYVNES
jgi:hypothetical protein